MLYYARTAPSIKARRAFTRVLVAFTVSEKRPTKVCGTRELRYMTKLCVCMSDFPSLEIYFVNTKQGEITIFVRKKKDTSIVMGLCLKGGYNRELRSLETALSR